MNQTNNDTKPKLTSNGKWIAAGLFAVSLAIIVGAVKMTKTPAAAPQEESTEAVASTVTVRVTSPQMRTFEERVVTQGNVEAKNTSQVSPKIPGVIERFFVDEGDSVVAGETDLFLTDAAKLKQNVIIQEHALAVTQCALDQAKANQTKVKADLDKATLDYERFKRLLANESTTQDVFEQQESRFKQVTAAYALVESQVALSAEQVKQALAALTIAQKDLSDCTVKAPITGRISQRTAEPGEMGDIGKPVLHIDDTDTLEVSLFLPAALYPKIIVDQTPLRISVSGIAAGPQVVTYKSPTIHSKLRTFEVKTLLKDCPDGIAPGAMAQVTVILQSREALGVPSEAIQTRNNQSVLFTADQNVATEKVVTTGLESDGWIEIATDNVTLQDEVISMGQYQVDDGTLLTVQKEDR